MGSLLIILVVLLVGPLSLVYGADSRRYDERDRRSWWPGAPRA